MFETSHGQKLIMRNGGKFLAGFILTTAVFLGGYFARGTEMLPDASDAAWLPSPGLTPGIANPKINQSNIRENLCKKGWSTKSIRPDEGYTEALKKKNLQEARYTDRNPKHYEQDHLISLEIGGDPSDPRNLWPEPYAGRCGAHVKDKLENKLHDLVCAGKVTLAQAQHDIATNWIAAYRRYIGALKCQ